MKGSKDGEEDEERPPTIITAPVTFSVDSGSSIASESNAASNNFFDMLDLATDSMSDEDVLGMIDDYDDDEPLSWRMEPETSLSDWTIVILSSTTECNNTIDDNNDTEEGPLPSATYHVHKSILSVGPCKSDYFACLFKQQRYHNESCSSSHREMTEFATNTSTITLEHAAAKEFPALLDFMYSQDDGLDLRSENAAALRYLSQYFGIRKLFMMTSMFIRADLGTESAPRYLREGAVFHDHNITSRAADICARDIGEYDSSELVRNLSVDLLAKIMSSKELDKCSSVNEHLSTTIAQFCLQRPKELNCQLLAEITLPITRVSKDASMFLYVLSLELEQKERETEINNNHEQDESFNNNAYDVHEALELLRSRCMDSSSTCWRDAVLNHVPRVKTEGKETKEGNDNATATTTATSVTSLNYQQQQRPYQLHELLSPTSATSSGASLETASDLSYSNMPAAAKIDLLERSLRVANQQINGFLDGVLDGVSPFRCPKRHVLKLCRIPDVSECDSCQVKYNKGTPMFACWRCDFDMCTNCATQRMDVSDSIRI